MWSYGVLLYEIVTLGAFPFQGMSNPEVYVSLIFHRSKHHNMLFSNRNT